MVCGGDWLCSVGQMMGLICVLLTTTCLFLLALPWSRWFLRRNYFQALLEDSILEQTENILTSQSGKPSAAAVSESLLASSPPGAKLPSSFTNIPSRAERHKVKKEIFLNLKLKWQRVAYIAGSIIETLPNSAAHASSETANSAAFKDLKIKP